MKKISSPAKPSQEKRLQERRSTPRKMVTLKGQDIVALRNVYDTSTDTELMIDAVEINKNQTFAEIGCGTGAVSLFVARRAGKGIGVDINTIAVKNSNLNKKLMNIKNVDFIKSDLFENIKEKFDAIICNPPYGLHKPADETEMMFWDEDNNMKKRFFNVVKSYLKPNGQVYFGWANFGDIDQNLPEELAKKAGLSLIKKYSRKHKNGERIFFVYHFK